MIHCSIGKTIVVGRNAAIVLKLIYVLTYFIRSSEVLSLSSWGAWAVMQSTIRACPYCSQQVFELEVAAKRYALTPPEQQLAPPASPFSPGLDATQPAVALESPVVTPVKLGQAGSTSLEESFYSALGTFNLGSEASDADTIPENLDPSLTLSSVAASNHEASFGSAIPDTSFLSALDLSQPQPDSDGSDLDDKDRENDKYNTDALITSLAALSFAEEEVEAPAQPAGIESSTPTSNGNAISEWLRRSRSASRQVGDEHTPVAAPLRVLAEEELTEVPMRTSLCVQVGYLVFSGLLFIAPGHVLKEQHLRAATGEFRLTLDVGPT